MKKTIDDLPAEIMVKQAAEILGVDIKTIRNMINRGELIARKLPGKTSPYLVNRESLIAAKQKRDQSAN